MVRFARQNRARRMNMGLALPTGTKAAVPASAPVRKRAGNQQMQRLLQAREIQPKLTVNQPGDRFEHEADRVAETVMRMPDSGAKIVRHSSEPPSVQRMCAGCDEESHRKPGLGVESVREGFKHPTSGGRPLPDSERRFFESRLGRDLSSVQIHTGPQASEAARSVNALAYTMGNYIVFAEGRYRLGTDDGRKLLAHELAHVVQQGEDASKSPGAKPASVQRLGDPSQAPPGMICPIATTSSADPVATNVLFPISASSLSAAAVADIDSFVGRWNAAGTNPPVRVDGFASTDGPEPTNWTLSCNRASAVARELETPSSGVPGIPNQFIDVFSQGETSEFGTALEPNRRATISANLTPIPACANPGDSRTLDLQPVFLRTDPADAAPTGVSWTRRFNEANAIWGKLGVTFVEIAPMTVDTPLKTTGASDPELLAVMALRNGPGVEIFLVDNDVAHQGGAASLLAGCEGAGKTVMSDRGTSDTLLAHEIGHIMGIHHPGALPNPGDPGTIMQATGSHSVDNSRRNTMANFAAILCPAPSGSTCLNPDP